MSFIVKGIKSLFGGGGASVVPDNSADLEATQTQQLNLAQQQQDLASIAQLRTQQATADAGSTSNSALAALGTAPRGQRLLISSKDGGLATTLGGST